MTQRPKGYRRAIAARNSRIWAGIAGRALQRLWGRDVMLFTGGVSFFALLAVFPAIAILIGLYSLLATPQQAAVQAEMFSQLMPAGAGALFEDELKRLVAAPRPAVSLQSGFAVIIGAYATHRGFKALLAGLSFIHDEDKPRGFVSFNFLALLVLVAAFILSGLVTAGFLTLRVLASLLNLRPFGESILMSEWTWTSAGLLLGMTLIYRYAMSRDPVAWRASVIGGAAASVLFVAMSMASAFYVEQVIELGATYGSISTVVVLLIWLSWNVNAVFFGGALATEAELALWATEPGTRPVRPETPMSAGKRRKTSNPQQPRR